MIWDIFFFPFLTSPLGLPLFSTLADTGYDKVIVIFFIARKAYLFCLDINLGDISP